MKQILVKLKNSPTFWRFVLVGTIGTIIDFSVLFYLQHFFLPVLVANLISTSVAFIFSFTANKKYTFQSTGQSLVREISLFVAVTLFGIWVLQTIIIALAMPLLGHLFDHTLALLLAKAMATGVTMVWNYVLYKTIVFKNGREAA